MLNRTISSKWAVLSLGILFLVAVAPYTLAALSQSQVEEQTLLEYRHFETVAAHRQLVRDRRLEGQWRRHEDDREYMKRWEDEHRDLKLSPRIAATIVAETSRELLNHLHSFRWPGAGTSRTESRWSKSYDYFQNPRLIRLLAQYRREPENLVPLLRERFREIRRRFRTVPSTTRRSQEEIKNLRVSATSILYLLTELGDYDSLPLFLTSTTNPDGSLPRYDRSIVPADMAVYAMHELCKIFPRDGLTDSQRAKLDEVLRFGQSLDSPVDGKVVGWEALVPESSTTVLQERFPALIVRRWVLSFKEPEIDERNEWPELVFALNGPARQANALGARGEEFLSLIRDFTRDVCFTKTAEGLRIQVEARLVDFRYPTNEHERITKDIHGIFHAEFHAPGQTTSPPHSGESLKRKNLGILPRIGINSALASLDELCDLRILTAPTSLGEAGWATRIETSRGPSYDEGDDRSVLRVDIVPTFEPNDRIKLTFHAEIYRERKDLFETLAADIHEVEGEVLLGDGETLVLGGFHWADVLEESGSNEDRYDYQSLILITARAEPNRS